MEDVDHSVEGYVVDYLTCGLLFCLGSQLVHKHGWVPEAWVQYFMSAAYLMGSLGHHLFANRAQTDQCANHYFYLVWSVSYPCMSLSNLVWYRVNVKNQSLMFAFVCLCHFACNALIVLGSVECVKTVKHFDGHIDPCPADGIGAQCDHIVYYGEAFYFAVWFATFVLISLTSKSKNCFTTLQTLILVFGPLQILVVYNFLPNWVLTDVSGAQISEAVHAAVTYKTAVCVSHICIQVIALGSLAGKDIHHK
jgi:hypothetical protein